MWPIVRRAYADGHTEREARKLGTVSFTSRCNYTLSGRRCKRIRRTKCLIVRRSNGRIMTMEVGRFVAAGFASGTTAAQASLCLAARCIIKSAPRRAGATGQTNNSPPGTVLACFLPVEIIRGLTCFVKSTGIRAGPSCVALN